MDYNRLLKRAGYYVFFAAAAYISIKMTTYGWLPSPRATGNPDPAVAAELRAHVEKLALEIGPRDPYRNNEPRLRLTEKYLTNQLKALGYKPVVEEFKASGTVVRNITAVKTGTTLPDETLLLGAHYDTFENPGADDNASGVAGVLVLARQLAKTPLQRTVKFAFFPNEEPPFFRTQEMGSAVWAAAAQARGEKLLGFIDLEMIGFYSDKPKSQKYPPFIGVLQPNKANFIAQVSDFRSRRLAKAIDSEFRKNSGLPLVTITLPRWVPGADFSDHRNFWDRGYAAVMFTDTSFYRNKNCHKATDLPDTLNYELYGPADRRPAPRGGLSG